ncbi:diphthine--ammonia ligase [Tamlana sp. s12]|uniref:Dph6-related ATP pyrophosphatase n=1 Tax=Tamlana sp. s12 TaxID=1630406 RepID=UPI000801B822|nr:diphthine--ammonia ligase [Tamlana sp. s12]OBQ55438.1 adenosine nucleotide hydrolase [Tamlana sp. s12]QQY83906.1 diphthine--ammonia ligase [Tamlana sp. s12]
MRFLCSWSGGKDSCYAFYKVTKLGFEPTVLLNVMNEFGDRSRSHGIPKDILQAQAEALGLPIHFFSSTWTDYEVKYIENLKKITQSYPLTHAVFGDIDIESHRAWEEKVSAAAELEAILPLWQGHRKQLVLEMIAAGIEAIIVSCNQELGPDYLGRTMSSDLVEELENKGIDACGENGEFHTLVVNAPFFKNKIDVDIESKAVSSNYNFANLKLVSQHH